MLAEIRITKTASNVVPGKNYYLATLTHENGNVVLLTLIEEEFNLLVKAGHISTEN